MAWRRLAFCNRDIAQLLLARASSGGPSLPPAASALEAIPQRAALSPNDPTLPNRPSASKPVPITSTRQLCSTAASHPPPTSLMGASSGWPCGRQSVRCAASNASDFDLISVDIQMARVDMYYPGGFTVSNIQMPGPVFLCYRMSLLWKAPSSVEDLSPSDLPLLSLIKPPPDFLVIGTGKSYKPISKELMGFLKRRAISVEVMDTVNAAATFNILNQESRNVAACLFTL